MTISNAEIRDRIAVMYGEFCDIVFRATIGVDVETRRSDPNRYTSDEARAASDAIFEVFVEARGVHDPDDFAAETHAYPIDIRSSCESEHMRRECHHEVERRVEELHGSRRWPLES